MKSFLVFMSAVFSVAAPKPLPDDIRDQSTRQGIPRMPALLASAPNEGLNPIFTSNSLSSQYQPSAAADLSVGLPNPYPLSTAGESSAVLPGTLIPADFDGGELNTAAAGELASEILYKSDPPCIQGFGAFCCNGSRLCIWSKSMDFEKTSG